jgi:hypothetical protein
VFLDFPKVRFSLLAFISAAVALIPALEPGTDFPLDFAHLSAGVFFGHLALADCATEMLPGFPKVRFSLLAFISAAVVSIPAFEPGTDLPFYFFRLPAGILFGHLAFADRPVEFLLDFPPVRFGPVALISTAVVLAPALEPGTDAPFYFFHLPAGVLFGYLAFAHGAMEMLPYFPEVRFGLFAFVSAAVMFVLALESGEGLSLYFAHLPSGVFLRHLAFFDRVLELGPDFPEARMDFFLLVLSARVFFTGLGVFRDRLPFGAGVFFAQLPACYRRL